MHLVILIQLISNKLNPHLLGISKNVIQETCSAERGLASHEVLAKVTVAGIGDFGECLQALALLNTPLVCYHFVILNFFSLSYKAQDIFKQKCQRSGDW